MVALLKTVYHRLGKFWQHFKGVLIIGRNFCRLHNRLHDMGVSGEIRRPYRQVVNLFPCLFHLLFLFIEHLKNALLIFFHSISSLYFHF